MSLENYKRKYGFKTYTESFSENPRIRPHLIRYVGMGTSQILASFLSNPDKYILVTLGGSSNADRKYNLNIFMCLSENDGKPLNELEPLMGLLSSIKINETIETDSGKILMCEEMVPA